MCTILGSQFDFETILAIQKLKKGASLEFGLELNFTVSYGALVVVERGVVN